MTRLPKLPPERHCTHPHSRLTVDLGAIASNLEALRELLVPGMRLAGVVKSDAYGHGLVPVSRCLQENGCDFLCVATVDEGRHLRAGGITLPVMVMLGLAPHEAPLAVAEGLTPLIADLDSARALAGAAVAAGIIAQCQLKVDTGMSRLGLVPEDVMEMLQVANGLEGLVVTGLASHLSTGGDIGCPYAAAASRKFSLVMSEARQQGFDLPDSSLAGSGGMLSPPVYAPGPPALVRVGISLYGGLPSPDCADIAQLKDAMALTSRLIAVRQVKAGTAVSYGRTWAAPQDTVLGVVPVGYANGYLRSLTGQAQALVAGRRVPVVGRVCMNLIMLDLAKDAAEKPGDRVTLLGAQSGQRIGLTEMAAWAGTISYEITCALGAANPTFYED